MAATAAAWSNTCILRCSSSSELGLNQEQQQQQGDEGEEGGASAERVALLAVGCKGGCVQIWRYNLPKQYSSSSSGEGGTDGQQDELQLQYLGAVRVTNGAYVTSLTWAVLPAAAAAAAGEGAAAGSGSCAVLSGAVCRRQAGDVLLLAVGTSSGDVTLWSADSAAAASGGSAQQVLTSLGTALLPDRQPALVLNMTVVAAAANPAAAAAAAGDPGPSSRSDSPAGWQLLLAAGKNLGSISVWRSGALVTNSVSNTNVPHAYSQQQLSLAVSMGESSSRRCHGVGFVTGLAWSPLEQQLSSCGADGQLLSWVWTKAGLQVGVDQRR
jgi:WD40 repeat protein